MRPEEVWQQMFGPPGPQFPPAFNPFGNMLPPPPYGGFPQPPFVPAWMQSRPISLEDMIQQHVPEFPYMMAHEGGTGNGRAATRKAGGLV